MRTWDTRWIGAKSTATSPFETTDWYYDDPVDLEPWGKVGLVQATERDFGAAWGEPVRFEYRYDVQGRTLGTRFPSGTHLWQMTSHGVPDVAYVVRNGMQSTIEDYQFAYDDFGMVAGWGQVAPAWSGSAPVPDHPHDFEVVRSSPTTLDATVWNSPAGPSYGVTFAQGADGRLVSKLFDLGTVIEADLGLHGMDYGYDALGRVARAENRFWGLDPQSGQPVEERVVSSAYGYDTMGNVQALEQRLLQQDGSVFDVALDYDPTGPFAQLGRRFVPSGPPGPGGQPLMLENGFHHDNVTGRVIGSYMAMMPGTEETQATVTGYFYDGTGKLACVDGYELQGDLGTSPGLTSPGLESADPPDPEPDFQASKWLDLRYHYDLNDELVARERFDTDGWVLGNNYTGQVGETELWFQGWQLDFVATSEGYTPRVVEHVLPWLDVLSDELGFERDAVLLFREPDGHVLLQLDEVGDVEGVDVLGPYGLAAGRMAYGTGGNPDPGPGQGGFERDVRDLHQLHGMQLDREADLTRMGVRHVMMTGDGRWLQPEPLLHLGPGDAQLGSPRAMFGAYAMGVPTHLQDRSGYNPEQAPPPQTAAERYVGLLSSFTGGAPPPTAEAAPAQAAAEEPGFVVQALSTPFWETWGNVVEFFGGNVAATRDAMLTLAHEAANDPRENPLTLMAGVGQMFRIHWGGQGKHVRGHANFDPDRSELTVDAESLLQFAGTGQQANATAVGQAGSRERVNFGFVIGIYKNQDGSIVAPTTVGIIHYKNGNRMKVVPGAPQCKLPDRKDDDRSARERMSGM